jgi:GT2 family glycosyltransferase
MTVKCTVILVSYNSQKQLTHCIPSILANTIPVHLIVVDNHSQDGTVSWLKAQYPQVDVYENSANLGYGAACNRGMDHALGDYWCIANPDTVWEPEVLARLLDTARQFPEALINPAILQPNGLVNAYGNMMHITGITSCAGFGETWSSQGDRYRFPLLASGAVLFAHRSVWQRLGGFDPVYFLYFEDTNLSLRAALLNMPVVCDTRAKVVHHYDLKMSPQKFYWLERNRLLTLLLIFDRQTLTQLRAGLLITEMATWAFAFIHGPRYWMARVAGYWWLWTHREVWKAERRAVQATRQVSDAVLLARVTFDLPLNQVMRHGRWAQWVNRRLSKLYHRALPKEVQLCE